MARHALGRMVLTVVVAVAAWPAFGVAEGKPMRIAIPGDANLDEVVDLDDFIILKAGGFGGGVDGWLLADFDGDADTDLDDFVTLKGHFGLKGTEGLLLSLQGWDFDFDGDADVDDLALVEACPYGEFMTGQWTGPAVPEPVSLSLLALGGLAAIRRRR